MRIALGLGMNSSNGPVWTPASEATLALWLRGDSLHDDGSAKADLWNDKSTFSRNFSQATSGSRPPIVSSDINGKPGINGTGSVHLASTQLFPSGSGTVAAVFKATSLAGNQPIICKFFNQTSFYLGGATGQKLQWFANDNTKFAQSNSTLNDNAGHYVIGRYTQGSGLNELFVDGVLQTTTGTTSGAITLGTDEIGITEELASSPGNFAGHIDEIIVFDAALTGLPLTNLQAYLKARYSL